jgi:hypothetical protein
MIPVTYDPMEGVAIDVQDHARWTSTHGEMISSYIHGAEEPTQWKPCFSNTSLTNYSHVLVLFNHCSS